MVEDWCTACGGEGWLDEGQAEALGFSLVGARTMTCPKCDGTGGRDGVEPVDLTARWIGAIMVLMSIALVVSIIAAAVLVHSRPSW